jgi:iron complex transport system permease protein
MIGFVRKQNKDLKDERKMLSSPTMLILLTIITIVFSVINIGIGAIKISPTEIMALLLGKGNPDYLFLIVEYRIPRIIVAVLVGCGLAVSGVIMQSTMQNNLAASDTIGVSSGAGLIAVIITLLFPSSAAGTISVAAFVGGAVAAVFIYLLAYRSGIEPIRLALVGIAVSAFCSAGIELLVSKANPNVNSALIWLSGSLWGRTWEDVFTLIPWIVVFLPLTWFLAIQMDVINLGDEMAKGLGIRVERIRLLLITCAVALAGSAVATVGTLGFVGLIGPHIARKLVGSRHKILVPTAGIIGSLLVLITDTIGRALIPPTEIPAGLIIAIVGAPYFLYLLKRESKRKFN